MIEEIKEMEKTEEDFRRVRRNDDISPLTLDIAYTIGILLIMLAGIIASFGTGLIKGVALGYLVLDGISRTIYNIKLIYRKYYKHK